jgi:hypothetical protein
MPADAPALDTGQAASAERIPRSAKHRVNAVLPKLAVI